MNPWKRKAKNKVKGLPGQRGRITSGLTVLIVLFFIGLWFLLISPPAPPVPINASTNAPIVTPHFPQVTPTLVPAPPTAVNASSLTLTAASKNAQTPTSPAVFGINGGTQTGTPVVVPAFQPLEISGLCTDAKQYMTRWQVLNPNPYAVKFTATTRSLATWGTQTGTVPAMSGGAPGKLQLQSFYESPAVIMTLTVAGSNSAPFSVNNPQSCLSTLSQ